MDPQTWIGRVLDGRYRITSVLGEGGMGVVLGGEHLSLQKLVAIKVIQPEYAGDAEHAARFAREAMASAQLDHPHVASALDYGTLSEGGAYLVMPLIAGQSLRDVLEEQKVLPWQTATEIAAQIADALTAAHARGIVHRDLKPENIMLEPQHDGKPRVRVLDFGIARVLAAEGSPVPTGSGVHTSLTRVGMVVGTVGYMAPEQAMGQAVDERADLYALGLLLWEMIAGEPLWQGDDPVKLLTTQLTTEPAWLAFETANPPAALQALVASLLKRVPDERPSTALAVRETLRSCGSLPAPVLQSVQGLFSLARWDAWTRTTRFLAAIAALVIVIVGIFLTIAWRAKKDTQETVAALIQTAKDQPPMQSAFLSSEAMQKASENLLESESRAGRRAAAKKILSFAPKKDIPAVLQALSELELARTCPAKRKHILSLRKLGDPKALPALQRLAGSPKTGCGFLSLNDCWSCLRPELAKTLQALR